MSECDKDYRSKNRRAEKISCKIGILEKKKEAKVGCSPEIHGISARNLADSEKEFL